jgi:hypothetical protein
MVVYDQDQMEALSPLLRRPFKIAKKFGIFSPDATSADLAVFLPSYSKHPAPETYTANTVLRKMRYLNA